MKKIFFAAILVASLALKAHAQTFEVPQNYSLKTKEDFTKYEADIIKAVDWLQATPVTEQKDKRAQAQTFFLDWLQGTSAVTVEIGKPIMELTDKNAELLMPYLGGYAKYALQHKEYADKYAANAAALKDLITKYTNEKGFKKDADVDKLVKADKDGKLEEWVKANF